MNAVTSNVLPNTCFKVFTDHTVYTGSGKSRKYVCD